MAKVSRLGPGKAPDVPVDRFVEDHGDVEPVGSGVATECVSKLPVGMLQLLYDVAFGKREDLLFILRRIRWLSGERVVRQLPFAVVLRLYRREVLLFDTSRHGQGAIEKHECGKGRGRGE